MATFSSSAERVQQWDVDDVVAVLVGDSPWQSFINWRATKQNIKSDFFSILPPAKYDEFMGKLGQDPNHAPGVTIKGDGTITMKEWWPDTKASYLLATLHEFVHLAAYKPGKADGPIYGKQIVSAAVPELGLALNEAFVQVITEDILSQQQIALPSNKDLIGYPDTTPIARAIIADLSDNKLVGQLIFKGQINDFEEAMKQIYTRNGWNEIRGLAKATPGRILQKLAGFKKQAQEDRKQAQKTTVFRPFDKIFFWER